MSHVWIRTVLLVVMICLMSGVANGQVPVGTPQFGSFSGGPDVVNLADLNVHLDIPMVHKSGRGTNFFYDLTFDSAVWYPVGYSGNQAWAHIANWGLASNSTFGSGTTGYLTYYYSSSYCYDQYGHPNGNDIYYGNTTYFDSWGIRHNFSGIYETKSGGCAPGGSGQQITNTYPSSAIDGSGLVVTNYSGPVITPGGGTISPPVNPTGGGAVSTVVDRNGNWLNVSSSGVITDTLGTTALTISGTSPTTFTYTAPSGAQAAYTVHYVAKNVKTNFGCSGISEYTATNVNLMNDVTLPDGSTYTFTYEPTPGYSGYVTGRVASITLPTGGAISYAYSGGSSGHITCADGSAATLTRTTPDGVWIFAQVKGTGAASTTTITAPQLPYDSTANQTTIQFQGIYETQRKVYQGSTTGTLLQTADTCYNAGTSPCTSIAISLPITKRSQIVTLPGAANLKSRHDEFYNGSGLPLETDDYDYGSGAPPASPLRKVITTYASLGNGIIDRPATITTQNSSGTTVAQTTYQYDQGTPVASSGTPQHTAVTGSRGNATTVSTLVQGTTTLSKTFTYFDTGTLNTITDVNGAVTTLNYPDATSTCGNAFPTSASEPLGLSRSFTWNCTGAVQTQVKDENSETTTTAYSDPKFWRAASVTDPTNAVTNFSYATSSPFNWSESTLTFNNGNSVVDSRTTLDTLGRPHVQQKRQGPASSSYDSTETDYDKLGRVNRVTVPYSGTAGQTSSTAPSTTTTYDALSRVLIVTDGGGGTNTSSYNQNDALVTIGPAPSGENTKRRQLEYDGLGRLTSVCEITGTSGSGSCAQGTPQTGFWTKYSYDALDEVTGVVQNAQAASAQQQGRTYVYDGMKRMTSEVNPESGTSTYTFDSASGCSGTSSGDLVKRVDAVGNTTCYTFDALHRKTSATYTGPYASVTPNKYFVYDAATVNGALMDNAKTHLAEAYTATSQNGTKITDLGFAYSPRGEVAKVYQSSPHSPGYYVVQETYWPHGAPNQLSITNPANVLPTITYGGTIGSTVGLDGEGRATQVTASSGQNPVPSATYNMFGLPTNITFGSTDADTFGFDPNTGRMTSYQFSVNSQSDSGSLTWNANGTLGNLLITDALNSADTQSCAYAFDDLKRVASVNCGSVWAQTFGYDAFGNITKSGSMSFTPVYKDPITGYTSNRFVSIPGITVSYDANGNVGNDGSHTYSWDAESRPVTIDGVNITYDALLRMAEQNRSGVFTEIVYGPTGDKLAFMNGSTLQRARIKLPGNASALYTGAGLNYYRHPDWLGSIRLGSTTARAMYADVAYAPFGEPYAQAGAADYSFSGLEQDTVASDYDAAAREYSIQGRWPSPDPAGINSTKAPYPQSWNRYAYALNNPLSLLDPTGLDCVYLNDAGSGVENIDAFSSGGECGSTGGYWIPGTVDQRSISIKPDTGWITANSNAGLGTFAAPCNGFGCGSSYSDAGTLIPGSPSSFGDSGIASPDGRSWVYADSTTGKPVGPVPVNAQSPNQQFYNGMNSFDNQLWQMNNAMSKPFMYSCDFSSTIYQAEDVVDTYTPFDVPKEKWINRGLKVWDHAFACGK